MMVPLWLVHTEGLVLGLKSIRVLRVLVHPLLGYPAASPSRHPCGSCTARSQRRHPHLMKRIRAHQMPGKIYMKVSMRIIL